MITIGVFVRQEFYEIPNSYEDLNHSRYESSGISSDRGQVLTPEISLFRQPQL